jgi:hypothetical protein
MKVIYDTIHDWYYSLDDKTKLDNFLFYQRKMWTDYELMDYAQAKVLQEKMRCYIKEG